MNDYTFCGALWRLPCKESEFKFADEYLLRRLAKLPYTENQCSYLSRRPCIGDRARVQDFANDSGSWCSQKLLHRESMLSLNDDIVAWISSQMLCDFRP